jgi:hypothetical protein
MRKKLCTTVKSLRKSLPKITCEKAWSITKPFHNPELGTGNLNFERQPNTGNQPPMHDHQQTTRMDDSRHARTPTADTRQPATNERERQRKLTIYSDPDPWHFDTDPDPWICTLNYGSKSRSDSRSGSCSFRQLHLRCPKNYFFCLFLPVGTLHYLQR